MSETPFSGRRLHFVGIGGAGMSGLALICSALGAAVTGSDAVDTPYLARVRAAGIEPAIGYDAANVAPGAEVVLSTAIASENPERVAAIAAGGKVLHRGALLGEVSGLASSIAVAGTHGKTTTCGMIAHALRTGGADPAFVIGGELRSAGTNAAWGDGGWIVVEADESDGSFLELTRDVAVVTNVELDHHARWRSLSELTAAFEKFTATAGVRILGPGVELGGPGERLSYGIGEGDLRADGVELFPMGAAFEIEGLAVRLAVPGRHNVLNALAALAACCAAGMDLESAVSALASFRGTGRRFEEHGRTAAGARVFDDYAHHPTEVRATLEAARSLEARRVIACFQPHLYSRTRELAREFGLALALADVVVVLGIYPARERAEDYPGVSGLLVAEAAADAAGGRPVWWLPAQADAARMLTSELREGDAVLTLGAGDIDRLARDLAEDAR